MSCAERDGVVMGRTRWGLLCGCAVVGWLVVLLAPSLALGDEGPGLAESACMSQLVPGEDAQGASRGCARAPGLIGASAVAVTQDGRNVYVASSGSDAVVGFSRNASGALKQMGCVFEQRHERVRRHEAIVRRR